MFGFGKKKQESPAASAKATDRARRSDEFEQRKAQNKAQLGMFMGLDEDVGGGGGGLGGGSFDVDDAELENELLMLLGDDKPIKSRSAPPHPPRPRPPPAAKSAGTGSVNANLELEDEDADDDEEVDLDDPELQAELGEILGESEGSFSHKAVVFDDDDASPSPPPPPKPTMSSADLTKLLEERLQLYETAKLAADKGGDTAKSRRFTRGIKTLKELHGKARAGRVVDEADIPPAVSLGISKSASSTSSNTTTTTMETQEIDIERDLLAPSPKPSHQRLPEPMKPTPPPVSEAPIPPPRPRIAKNIDPQPPPEPPVDYSHKHAHVPPLEPPVDYFENDALVLPKVNEAGLERLKDYKKAAVVLKRSGDTAGALNYLKLSKTLETLLNAGEHIDLGEFPPVPGPETEKSHSFSPHVPNNIVMEEQHQSHSEGPDTAASSETNPSSRGGGGEDIFHAPPPPTSIIEALQQRLDKYKSEVDKANSSSNSGKARRMGRIVKQYEEAIGLFKKGKPVPYEELPTPPGFGPIPIPGGGGGAAPVLLPTTIPPASHKIQVQPQPEEEAASPEKRTKPGPSSSGLTPSGTSTSSINRGAVGGKHVSKLTLQEKQLQEVQLRQKQYRDAAIQAKKRGDINQAREYLRISKGFDNLIEASKSGLPVDLKTLPSPPEALMSLESEDFELVSDQDCIIPSEGNLVEVFAKLEEDLKAQLKMCMRMREHFKAVGDVGSANRFETMALETKRDLDALRLAAKSGTSAPRYHYENRVFSITECNTDIKDDEIEITVVRGINYKSSSSIDTFIRVELPYPTPEEAQSQKSPIVKDSTDPEYNVTYKMNINRSARNFQRFTQRHGVKVEVWSKGGFLRSSSLFGVATVKLQPLGNKTTLHDAFEILDGRKVMGKVEVKIRLRDPVLTKQITQKKEKWLSIDRA